jgi:nitrogen fixation-related uncharacterized protein
LVFFVLVFFWVLGNKQNDQLRSAQDVTLQDIFLTSKFSYLYFTQPHLHN